MLIVVTRRIIVIVDLLLLVLVALVKLQELKYTNEFVLHVNDGEQAARSLADKYQLRFERQVGRIRRARHRSLTGVDDLGSTEPELFCLPSIHDRATAETFVGRFGPLSRRGTEWRSTNRLGRTATSEETCETKHHVLPSD